MRALIVRLLIQLLLRMENVVDDFQRVKLLLLGDSRVGKTMLRGAFLNASAGEIPGRAVGTKGAAQKYRRF